MTTDAQGQKILVVASDALLAALIGSLIETARLTPAFPGPGEGAEQALERTRPVAAVVLDADMEDVESDLFVARARRHGAELLLLGSADAIGRRMPWASSHSIRMFALPTDTPRLLSALTGVYDAGKQRRMGHGRRASEVQRAADGTIVFSDADGVRWSVYDRRSTSPRRNVVDRHFVSDAGEERRCDVSTQEAAEASIDSLTAQLARSTVVA